MCELSAYNYCKSFTFIAESTILSLYVLTLTFLCVFAWSYQLISSVSISHQPRDTILSSAYLMSILFKYLSIFSEFFCSYCYDKRPTFFSVGLSPLIHSYESINFLIYPPCMF